MALVEQHHPGRGGQGLGCPDLFSLLESAQGVEESATTWEKHIYSKGRPIAHGVGLPRCSTVYARYRGLGGQDRRGDGQFMSVGYGKTCRFVGQFAVTFR